MATVDVQLQDGISWYAVAWRQHFCVD